jgi:hypothetical protein
MNKKNIVPIVVVAVVVLAVIILIVKPWQGTAAPPTALEAFGQCLASKNITMYGAAWCSHCQNEKRALGEGFKYVHYVECPDNVQLCVEKGVEGYPTWITADGTKLVGEQGIDGLSKATGCPAPQISE